MDIKTEQVSNGLFIAWLEDEHGQVGPSYVGKTAEDASFSLGAKYAIEGQKFARPLDMIIPVEN